MNIEKSYTEIVNNYFEEVRTLINKKLEENKGIDVQKVNGVLLKRRQKIYEFLIKKNRFLLKSRKIDTRLIQEKFGSPEVMANYVIYEIENADRFCVFPYEGIWLGVCAGIAKNMGINTLWIRVGFIVLGLIFGIGLVLYLLLFFWMYRNSEGIEKFLRFSKLRLIINLIITVILFLCILIGFQAIVSGLYYLYVAYVGTLKDIGWLEQAITLVKMFTFVLCIASVIFSIYSALPMLNGWNETFGNLRSATIALFIFFVFSDLVYIVIRLLVVAFNTLLF